MADAHADYTRLARLLAAGDPRTAYRGRPDLGERYGLLPLPPVPKPKPDAEVRNLAPRPAPPRVQQEVAETISPTIGAYGLSSLLSEMALDAKGGKGEALAEKLPMALGIFAGVKAKTANLPKLELAKALEQQGIHRNAMWAETDWGRGRDGQWRFEISDDDVRYNPRDSSWAGAGPGSKLPHPALDAAYTPDDVIVSLDPKGVYSRGSYQAAIPATETTVAYAPQIHGVGRSPDEARSVGLHEWQHYVADREGFARGGNQREFLVDEYSIKEVLQGHETLLPGDSRFADAIIRAAHLDVPGFRGTSIKELRQHILAQQLLGRLPADLGRIPKKIANNIAWNQYRKQAGEVEARNVQKRRDMTPQQRRQTPPWETEDVPWEQQIVRMPAAAYGFLRD